MKRILSLAIALAAQTVVGLNAQAATGEAREFTVTGYYSPLPNQDYYVTGSYEAEKRLNGHGIQGADGTPVFPGMIAAPSSYAFGTVVCLPDFGCGSVHDRGGAIVEAGGRNIARHDRLDLWMGYGDEGLARALDLGLWHTQGTLYEPSEAAGIDIAVNFKAVTPIARLLNIPAAKQFVEKLYKGSQGKEVEELQKALQTLGFYIGTINGKFEAELEQAVLNFQLTNLVIDSETEAGAGGFGPKTQAALSAALNKYETQKALIERWSDFNFEDNLSKGKRDESVLKLQEILVQRELLDHLPTGYFGNLTKEALIEFQLAEGLIETATSAGAGSVGPKTRELLNELLVAENEQQAADQQAQLAFMNQKNELLLLAGLNVGPISNLIAKK